jgi:hypothetical protein
MNAVPDLERATREEVERATAPSLELPMRLFGDSSKASLVEAGTGITWSPGKMLALTGEAFRCRIQQRSQDYQRTNVSLSADNFFLTPRVGLNLRVGTENYGNGRRLNIGQVGAKFFFEDGSDVSVKFHRDSFWSDHDQRAAQQFNRLMDLAKVGPAFSIQGVSAAADKVLYPGHQLRIEAGGSEYADNNSRLFLYTHYQIGHGREVWNAIRPNIYWESFRKTSSAYFSPVQFIAFGNAFHTIRGNPRWNIEAQINPQALFTRSEKGFGIDGLLDVRRQFGPFSIGVGTFAFYDQPAHYTMWRAVVQFRVRLR